MCVSFCYLMLRRAASARCPQRAVKRVQGTGNRRAAARTRHPPSADDASGDDDGRPAVLGGGEPPPAPRTLALVHHHADHVAPLASALGRQAMDAVTSCRPAADSSRSSGAGLAARAEKTRAGDINASSGSSKGSASRCRRRRCAHGFGKVASDRSARAGARPGANSYERIGKACSPSISSPWRRSGCNGSTCSSSSSWAARRVHFAGCTPNPSGPWVTQQARQLTWTLAERPEPLRFLIRDRDQKFTESFDEVFPERWDRDRSHAVSRAAGERRRGTVRADGSLGVSGLAPDPQQRASRARPRVFVDHYNGHRPHRALALTPPHPARPPSVPTTGETRVQRRDRLGGVIREYVLAA